MCRVKVTHRDAENVYIYIGLTTARINSYVMWCHEVKMGKKRVTTKTIESGKGVRNRKDDNVENE